MKIAELARQLIRLSGFSEDEIQIRYTGLRPGEKLYEEPLADREKTLPTPHPKLRVAQADGRGKSLDIDDALQWLDGTKLAAPGAVRAKLKLWVPEYTWNGESAGAGHEETYVPARMQVGRTPGR